MYRPTFRPQYPDPTTTLDWFDCTMASGAMALDFHTLGKLKLWGGQLRRYSGDFSGGTGIPELQRAWNHYGYTIIDRRGYTFSNLLSDLRAGRGIVLQGDYDVLVGADTCQGTFNGDHAVYVNPEFNSTKSAVRVGDPLCKTWKWIAVSHLRAYAEKLGRRMYGYSTNQKIFYAATAAHLPKPVTVTLHLWAGAVKVTPFPTTMHVTNVPAGRKANVRVGPGTTYPIGKHPDGSLYLLPNGSPWNAYQKKSTNGVWWYGNLLGNRWINGGNLK